ncbi:MAG: YfiR family protein [Nitrospira sp.]|nr:YfiR family protein [Nitrospira sp.]
MGRQPSWRVVVFAGLVTLWLSVVPGHAVGEEYEIKAAFLYNFSKFVEWPEMALPSKAETFTICVIGDERMMQATSLTLQDKQVQGRTVVTRSLRSLDEASACQVLFVEASAIDVAEWAGSLAKTLPILTVGESDRFIQKGGIIKLFVEDGKLRFEISPQAAARAQLKVSSKLLKLGRIVEAP